MVANAQRIGMGYEGASPAGLQEDLDHYRDRYRRQRGTIKTLRAQLKECRAKYLSLQQRYDAEFRPVEDDRDDVLDVLLSRAERL